mmetsp:Transcript_49842/g.124962  ORF Transcript_49842/g.124962 Transcript_49842/m.124962 type:complete len:331 (-) Transcript_49842:109-1101(-)
MNEYVADWHVDSKTRACQRQAGRQATRTKVGLASCMHITCTPSQDRTVGWRSIHPSIHIDNTQQTGRQTDCQRAFGPTQVGAVATHTTRSTRTHTDDHFTVCSLHVCLDRQTDHNALIAAQPLQSVAVRLTERVKDLQRDAELLAHPGKAPYGGVEGSECCTRLAHLGNVVVTEGERHLERRYVQGEAPIETCVSICVQVSSTRTDGWTDFTRDGWAHVLPHFTRPHLPQLEPKHEDPEAHLLYDELVVLRLLEGRRQCILQWGAILLALIAVVAGGRLWVPSSCGHCHQVGRSDHITVTQCTEQLGERPGRAVAVRGEDAGLFDLFVVE